MLTLQTLLREVVSKAIRSLSVMRLAGKLFDCPHVLKSYFNAFVLPNLKHCAPVWMSSASSHLSLLDRVAPSAERFYEGELCWLGHRRKLSAMCLLYENYDRADLPLHEYLHHFVAACNTRASAALCELGLVIPRCRTNQFSRSFLPVALRLWNLLSSDVYSGGTFNSFKSAV